MSALAIRNWKFTTGSGSDKILIVDNFLDDPLLYRQNVLKSEFRSYDFGTCVFHGIAVNFDYSEFIEKLREIVPNVTPVMTFARLSPLNQQEPNFIHTDLDMGGVTALLYLNPDPPDGDGTCFWTHKPTGDIQSDVPHDRSIEGRDVKNWTMREMVHAKFNRLVLFPSIYFHSRAIYQNWGSDKEARLVQVMFGKGEL